MLKPHLADVTCQVADGIATVCSRWQILLPGCTIGCVFGYVCLLQADGIALGLLQLEF